MFLGLTAPACVEATGHCQDPCEQTLSREMSPPAPDNTLCIDDPAPSDINEVLIGYFGPTDPCAAQGIEMWRAAGLAIEQANLAGGYKGLPFRLEKGGEQKDESGSAASRHRAERWRWIRPRRLGRRR